MKIFVSWSGEPSRAIAEQFRLWLPNVLQFARPYFTPSDIDKGTKWQNEIGKELAESSVGVIIVTESNAQKPWITFEAGALSKVLDESRVCTVLFGIESANISEPLSLFQATKFNEVEMRKLIFDINKAKGEEKLADEVVRKSFDKWWPDLQKEISKILDASKNPKSASIRPDRDILEEILSISRSLRANDKKGEFAVTKNNDPALSDEMHVAAIYNRYLEMADYVCGSWEGEGSLPKIVGQLRKLESPIRQLMQTHSAPVSAFKKLEDAGDRLKQAEGEKPSPDTDIFE